MTQYYDNTRIKDYRNCPRYFYIRHELGWTREGAISLALVNGLAWHDAMDQIWPHARDDISNMELLEIGMTAYNKTWEEQGMLPREKITMEMQAVIAPRGPFIAKEIMFNYIGQRRDFICEHALLDIERPFAVPIKLDSDGKVVTWYIGRLDKVIKHRQYGITVIEHKTTTAYSKDKGLRPSYVSSYSPNSQVDGYMFSANMIYEEDVSGIWIDATLFHKTIHNVHKFIPVDRAFAMIDTWKAETLQWIERIENEKESFRNNAHLLKGTFPKNTDSCDNYGGCTYRDICKFIVDPSTLDGPPDGYKLNRWAPFDILKIEQLGLEAEK